MDEKVLNLLTERVKNSTELYQLHNNEEWLQTLFEDVDRLKNFHMKNAITKIHSEFNGELPNEFNFKHVEDDTIYTAKGLNKGYRITWEGNDNNLKSVMYSCETVSDFIKDGTWKIVD